eukprot:tig00021036_g17325.t1
MVVRIRLARFGHKDRPFYRIHVADSRRFVQKKFIENVGTYDPLPNRKTGEKELVLETDRVKYWLSVGAQPSDTVARLLWRAGILPEPPRKVGNPRADVPLDVIAGLPGMAPAEPKPPRPMKIMTRDELRASYKKKENPGLAAALDQDNANVVHR